MTLEIKIAPVRKSIRVKAPINVAFDVFTSGITRWWPLDKTITRGPVRKVLMETRAGGRWFEVAEDGSETLVATIAVYEPPRHLLLIWNVNEQFRSDATMKSEVDVRFTAEGPDATLVELTHDKFETMGAEAGASMSKSVDGGWPGMLELFGREAERAAA